MKEFLIGAAGIVLAGAAFAQTAAPQAAPQSGAVAHPAPMGHFDRDQTRDEMVAKVREHFAQLDANRDGFLTKDEAEAGRKMIKERFREKLGERGDHRKSGHNPAAAFDRLDTNKDGSISRDEFAKGREMRIERRVERTVGQPGTPGAPSADGQRMKFRHMGGAMMGGHMFEMADANKDSRVSLQEATDAAARHFDMADANRDGRITREERRTMHRQMIEKRRAAKAG